MNLVRTSALAAGPRFLMADAIVLTAAAHTRMTLHTAQTVGQRHQEYYGTYEYRENINRRQPTSEKDWLVALLLCIIVGTLGVHRFYVGKIGTGILWLLTGGCFLVGWIVDIVMIANGSFTDGEGFTLKNIR